MEANDQVAAIPDSASMTMAHPVRFSFEQLLISPCSFFSRWVRQVPVNQLILMNALLYVVVAVVYVAHASMATFYVGMVRFDHSADELWPLLGATIVINAAMYALSPLLYGGLWALVDRLMQRQTPFVFILFVTLCSCIATGVGLVLSMLLMFVTETCYVSPSAALMLFAQGEFESWRVEALKRFDPFLIWQVVIIAAGIKTIYERLSTWQRYAVAVFLTQLLPVIRITLLASMNGGGHG